MKTQVDRDVKCGQTIVKEAGFGGQLIATIWSPRKSGKGWRVGVPSWLHHHSELEKIHNTYYPNRQDAINATLSATETI
jgi:hypothetical protein